MAESYVPCPNCKHLVLGHRRGTVCPYGSKGPSDIGLVAPTLDAVVAAPLSVDDWVGSLPEVAVDGYERLPPATPFREGGV